MPKVTFTSQSVVCIHIKGEKDSSPRRAGEPNLPRCRMDGGLVHRFLDFQKEERVFALSMGGRSVVGEYLGFFTAEDAAKIEAWLIEQGGKREWV